ncbi:MAG: Iron complex outer rane receptor protein [Ignavibacteria bacterium]|nr:Iron complex outer rane receptor protein [Ignavibacteria bacterium]
MKISTSRILYFFLLCLSIQVTSYAKTITINGRVFDEKSQEPLVGVTARIENTPFGAISDKNGRILIKSIPNDDYKLILSMIGYKTKILGLNPVKSDTLEFAVYLESQPFQTQEVIVSASKRLQAVQEVPISVSVIDSRSILQRSVTKLDEAVSYTPGINISGDDISIRGSSGFAFGVGSRVTLLLDGFPMLSGDLGDMKFDALPFFVSERVEIVKGAGSALYGTSAIGGVINVVTRQQKEIGETSFRAFSGFYSKPVYPQWEFAEGYQTNSGFDIGFSKKFGKLSALLTGGYYTDKGYTLYNDSYRVNGFAKLKYDFTEATDLAVAGGYFSDDHADWVYWNSLDSATKPPTNTDLTIRLISRKLALNAELKHIISIDNFLTFKNSILKTNFENNYPETSSDFRGSKALGYSSELQMNSSIMDSSMLTYGINFNFNSVESKNFGTHTQQIIAAYGQGEFKPLDKIILTVGLRGDYENTPSAKHYFEVSPKIGILIKFTENFQSRCSFGFGFRAPSIAERFSSIRYNGLDVSPNPDLKPERSRSFEIGYNYFIHSGDIPFEIDLSFFENYLNNLIEPKPLAEDIKKIKFMNITEAKIIGVELGVKTFLLGFLGIETGLTAMDPIDLSLRQTLKYRANIIWYSRCMIDLSICQFFTDYRFLNRVENIDHELLFYLPNADSRVPIHTLDLRLVLDLNKSFSLPLSLTINAKNILNYYYSTAPGNLAPVRFLGVQLDGKF